MASEKVYTFDDFINVKWVKDPQISPDGKYILIGIDKKDLKENKTISSLHILDLSTGKTKNITSKLKSASDGKWSPDSKQIAFTGDDKGDSQIFTMNADGSNVKKVTSLANGASSPFWSNDGKKLLFTSDVYENCKTEEENKQKKEERENSKIKAQLIENLPYQVFDHYRNGKDSHIFVMTLPDGKPHDLVSGNVDAPPIDLGGKIDYAFSPDSKEVCYVTNRDKNLAWSTNNDLFIVDPATFKTTKITDNPANDCGCVYSPDGRYIAFTSSDRAGFEADRRVLSLYDRKNKSIEKITDPLDRSVGEYAWTPDSKNIVFVCEDSGYSSIYKVNLENRKIGKLTDKTTNDSINISPDGKTIYFVRQSMTKPGEVYSINLNGSDLKQLTAFNANFEKIPMNPAEDFTFKASDGLDIQGFIVRPPHFDPNKKYPLIYMIHGGPQSPWSDDFHPRWNTELFTQGGYVVAAVNFRGSGGFGQKFTDRVSKDWGGRPYQDLMEGIDYILKTYTYVDGDKMAAVGASYGGYMVNWIMGHTDRFKCCVCHAGVFNTISEYGTTEELWFPEWEFGGTPYQNRELYEKWNPVNYVSNFKTPCLVIHGDEDYRVPVSEGKQLFTALQRNGIQSQFLNFPDECHFVRKPQNLQLWYKTMDNWFAKFLK